MITTTQLSTMSQPDRAELNRQLTKTLVKQLLIRLAVRVLITVAVSKTVARFTKNEREAHDQGQAQEVQVVRN